MQKKSVKAVGAACIALAAGLGCGGDGGRVPPPQARWHNNQGVVYMDQHNYVRGREHFEEAARLAPGYATARANLGIALYSLGKYDSARVALGQALERDGGHLHALYTLGLIDHAQGRDYAAALDRFRKVAARDGEDPLVWYFLGRTHAKVGRADSAVAAYERAIALDPTHLSAHYALAQELRQQGDLEGLAADPGPLRPAEPGRRRGRLLRLPGSGQVRRGPGRGPLRRRRRRKRRRPALPGGGGPGRR